MKAGGRERRGHRCVKKIRGHTFKIVDEKYCYIQGGRSGVSKGKLCRLLEVSLSGYYVRLTRGESSRVQMDKEILRELIRLHQKYPAMGLDSPHQLLKPKFHCSRKRVHRLMKQGNRVCPGICVNPE